jgi:hypothetical protein
LRTNEIEDEKENENEDEEDGGWIGRRVRMTKGGVSGRGWHPGGWNRPVVPSRINIGDF